MTGNSPNHWYKPSSPQAAPRAKSWRDISRWLAPLNSCTRASTVNTAARLGCRCTSTRISATVRSIRRRATSPPWRRWRHATATALQMIDASSTPSSLGSQSGGHQVDTAAASPSRRPTSRGLPRRTSSMASLRKYDCTSNSHGVGWLLLSRRPATRCGVSGLVQMNRLSSPARRLTSRPVANSQSMVTGGFTQRTCACYASPGSGDGCQQARPDSDDVQQSWRRTANGAYAQSRSDHRYHVEEAGQRWSAAWTQRHAYSRLTSSTSQVLLIRSLTITVPMRECLDFARVATPSTRRASRNISSGRRVGVSACRNQPARCTATPCTATRADAPTVSTV